MRPSGVAAEPRSSSKIRDWYEVRERPVGGFARLTVHQVLLVSWCRLTGRIGPQEAKLWWAAVEVSARRCEAAGDAPKRFNRYPEWAGLIGGGGGKGKARRGLRKLKSLGLLAVSKDRIQLITSPDELKVDDLSGYWSLVAAVGLAGTRGQPIPVPRTAVRLLAGGVGTGVMATMIGVMLRALRRRRLNGSWQCVSGGLVSTAWIADSFGVGHATVKHAMKHLQSLKWLTRLETPQWVQQRHGARTVLRLNWKRPMPEGRAAVCQNSTPRIEQKCGVSTRPIQTENSLRDKETKNSPRREPAGFSAGKSKGKEPSLKNVVLEDLGDTRRVLVLFEQAVAAKLIEPTEGERLNFVAAAEHALVKGTRNPSGLFMHVVRNRLWHYCTNDDEDAALERLKRHFFGTPKCRESEAQPPPRKRVEVVLSDDARLAAAVRRYVIEKRLDVEPLVLIKRERPEWTKGRWDAALDELDAARLQRLGLTGTPSGSRCFFRQL